MSVYIKSLTCFFVICVVAVLVGFPVVSWAAASSAKIERVEGYKASKRAVATIKDALASGDVAAVVEPARAMAGFAARLPSLYPQNANGEFVSSSVEAIWKNVSDFERKAKAFEMSAQELADVAASGTRDEVILRKSLTKMQDSCVACHRSYLGR